MTSSSSTTIDYETDTCASDTDMTVNDHYSYQLQKGGSLDISVCGCCGSASRTITGYVNRVYSELFGEVAATYRIHFGVNNIHEARAVIDLIILPPGSQSTDIREDTMMVSFSCVANNKGFEEVPSFRILDATKRPNAEMAEEALQPHEVTEDIREHAMELLEEIWEADSRIEELGEAATVATDSTSSLTEDLRA